MEKQKANNSIDNFEQRDRRTKPTKQKLRLCGIGKGISKLSNRAEASEIDPGLCENLTPKTCETANTWMTTSVILGQLVIHMGNIINWNPYTISLTKLIPGILKTQMVKQNIKFLEETIEFL